MPFTRRSYHTHLKSLARDGLIPAEILCLIPRTNLHRWRKESHDKYTSFGFDFGDFKDQEILINFAKSKFAKRVFSAYVRIIKTMALIAHGLPGFHQAVKEHQTNIIQIVTRVKQFIKLKRALRFFDISIPTFRQWSLQSQTSCFESLTGFCNRIYPNQLSRPEVLKLKDLLVDPKFQFWPVSSIALHSLRNNILPLNLNTWYKYVHKLGMSRPRVASRRKNNAISIRAERPHQMWHADITAFVTADHIRHYIYLVIDNFSRKILAWTVADRVSADIRKTTLEDALENTVLSAPSITLLTDGGPENASAVYELSPFLRSKLVHRVALVDVLYSNSLIEAHNKILKYNYLYRMSITDGAHLRRVIPGIVNDFNNRPHISLGGLAPNEAIENIRLDTDKNTQYISQAQLARSAYNLNHRCNICTE